MCFTHLYHLESTKNLHEISTLSNIFFRFKTDFSLIKKLILLLVKTINDSLIIQLLT